MASLVMMEFASLAVILFACLCPGHSRVIRGHSQYLTPDICSECTQISQLFTAMMDNKDTQDTTYKPLHDLCLHLPSEQQSRCISRVKTHLPQVLQFITNDLNPREACIVLGLCAIPSESGLVERPQPAIEKDMPSSVQFSPQCSLCLFVMKKLEEMLPTNMTEEAVLNLMGEVCNVLPASYKEQCDDFIDKYGKEIVSFLLSSAAPHAICAMLHLCLFKETSHVEMALPSDCESCRTLAVLSRLHLGLNSTELQTSSFLQSVCFHHPRAIPKCEVFTKLHGSRLQKTLGNQMVVPDACERDDLCATVQEWRPWGKNVCNLGPSYWCKDMGTAQKCGNVAFCEKYMWN